jgi:cob(I)alamin adenosyltransferase
MKIYTKTGDAGQTSLFGGGRVSKDHQRVAAYGMVDEVNAAIGAAVARVEDPDVGRRLQSLQHDLFALGAVLATPPQDDGTPHPHLPPMPRSRVDDMETWMDEAERELPELRQFVLPGGTDGAATLHLARTTCRRAERAVVHLATLEAVDADVVRFLNRLSDLLFTLARLENHRAGRPDVLWEK